jgi:hypothetical protein
MIGNGHSGRPAIHAGLMGDRASLPRGACAGLSWGYSPIDWRRVAARCAADTGGPGLRDVSDGPPVRLS